MPEPCETESWSVADRCMFGGGVPRWPAAEYIRLANELDLPAQNQLIPAVDAGEQRITHFFYDTEVNVGVFFGKVGGRWRVLEIEAIYFCDA